MVKKIIPILIISIILAGCAALLPSSQQTVKSPWSNYKTAAAAYEKIIPGKTTIKDLNKLGINPQRFPNIKILTFRDFLKLYLPNSSIKKSDLDEGVQECLESKNNCFGYEISPSFLRNKRKGNFWKDIFGFEKRKEKSGWKFKGLILIVNGVVVYKERPGGTPLIKIEKKIKKPLGPLQNGERVINFGIDSAKKIID